MSNKISNLPNNGILAGIGSGGGSGGTLTTGQNYISTHGTYTQPLNNTIWYPPATTGSIFLPSQTQNELRLRKVENGFICIVGNKEYVITDSAQVLKYLELMDQIK